MTKAASTIVIGREALLPALALVSRVVERRNTIPILSNILLAADMGTLTLTTTDLDMEMTTARPCQLAGKAISTTLPAAHLHDIVRKLPEGCEVQLSGDEQAWTISGGRSRFQISCLPASDFPAMTRADLTATFTLPVEVLKHMIETVRFAISTEETRYYLNGIHWHVGENGTLIAVATDGHRLARHVSVLPEAADFPGIIVPRKTVDSILKMLPEKGSVTVGIAPTRIVVTLEDGTVLVSKLIDGTYPDYQRVVPQGNQNRYIVDRAALLAAVDRVSTISTTGRAIRFNFGDGELALTAHNPDAGTGEDAIPVVMEAGQPVEIGFNGRYCLDLLNATQAENLLVELGDAGAPARLLPQDAGDNPPYFVLMPMRV
ncbi:DNA polymerase III subunit beta [Aquamicrobium terrae]